MGHARRSWLRDNGLTIALLAFFAASFAGHILAGNAAENAERALQGKAALGLGSYITNLRKPPDFLYAWLDPDYKTPVATPAPKP